MTNHTQYQCSPGNANPTGPATDKAVLFDTLSQNAEYLLPMKSGLSQSGRRPSLDFQFARIVEIF